MLNSGYSIPYAEIQPTQIRSYGAFSLQVAATIVPKYLAITGETRARIDRAIDRFDRALRRHQAEDSAVELATALESLLSDQGGELTWKIGLRSALLVEGTREEKIVTRKTVRALYRLRSKVLHTGSGGQEFDAQGLGKMKPRELIERATIVVASVLRAAIVRGNLPNWFEDEIGG